MDDLKIFEKEENEFKGLLHTVIYPWWQRYGIRIRKFAYARKVEIYKRSEWISISLERLGLEQTKAYNT